MNTPIFETWTFDSKRFIAIPWSDGNVYVVSETGDSYGAWWDVERFRAKQKKGEVSVVCSIKLSIRVTP